jgi:hypothetical protein
MRHHAHAHRPGLTVPRRRSASAPSLGLRVRVWVRSPELDLRLAEGVRPASSPELELRAEQLSSTRSRHALARGLTTAVDDAARRQAPWAPAVPIDRSGVLDAAGPLVCLARDLRAADDPPVRAVALVSFLLCDGIASPLYNPRSAVTVREIAQRARSALAPP